MDVIILIGSKGFLGSKILERMVGLKYQVVEVKNSAQLARLDIGTSAISYTIIWTAATVNPVSAESNPDQVRQEYDTFCRFIEDVEPFFAQISNFIFFSSAGCVYSGNSSNFSESDEAYGSNAYGRLKSSMETKLVGANFPYTILRISNVYGSGQRTGRGQGVIAEWLSAINDGLPIKIYGSQLSSRDYLYVDDLVSAVATVVEYPRTGIFNLGFGKSSTLSEIISILKECYENKLIIQELPSRITDRQQFGLNTALFQSTYSWKAKIDLKRGLTMYISQIKQ